MSICRRLTIRFWKSSGGLFLLFLCLGSLSRTAVADPGHPVVYSTFLGGTGVDAAVAVAIDPESNVYIAGRTSSHNFPLRKPWQAQLAGEDDLFLAVFDPAGALVSSTFFGGSGRDVPEAIALDDSGNILVAGFTTSVDLPTTPGALQEEYGGGTAFGTGDAFIAKFSTNPFELLYCSYIGGAGDDAVTALALDTVGDILLAGTTDSRDFPVDLVTGVRGKQDAFILKLDHEMRQVIGSTLIAGEDDEAELRLVSGPDQRIYFSGATRSTNFPATARHPATDDPPGPANWDGFFGILGPSMNREHLARFGGELDDMILDLALTSDGAVVITGRIAAGMPATEGVFQPQPGFGLSDGFVARLGPPYWKPEWFSYLGGSGQGGPFGTIFEFEYGYRVALDAEGSIYVTGVTGSPDFPLKDSLARFGGGDVDVFLAKISPDGRGLEYSTFLGGAGNEFAYCIAVGPDGIPVVAGDTSSNNFPVRNAWQPGFTGSTVVAFVTKISPRPKRPILDIRHFDLNLILSWPAEAEGFLLESNSNPEMGAWTAVPGAPLLLGSRKAVVVRSSAEARFFRLRRP